LIALLEECLGRVSNFMAKKIMGIIGVQEY
jgi:hypothetical protein